MNMYRISKRMKGDVMDQFISISPYISRPDTPLGKMTARRAYGVLSGRLIYEKDLLAEAKDQNSWHQVRERMPFPVRHPSVPETMRAIRKIVRANALDDKFGYETTARAIISQIAKTTIDEALKHFSNLSLE